MKTLENKIIPSERDFIIKHRSEIQQIAKQSWLRQDLDLSKFLCDGNFLFMSNTMLELLLFKHVDNSKPNDLFYHEYDKEKCKSIIFNSELIEIMGYSLKRNDKNTFIPYTYPYYEKTNPARIVEDTIGIFRTGDYTLIKESTNKEPDYHKVSEIIFEVLKKFNAYE